VEAGGRRWWLTNGEQGKQWWQLWLLVAVIKAKVKRIREEMF